MLRRLVFTLVVFAALAGMAPAALAQTTTSSTVVTSTKPSTVAPTTAPPATKAPTSTTVSKSTSTSSSSTTSTSVVKADKGGSGVSGKTIALIVGAVVVLLLLGLIIFLLIRQRDSKRWHDQAVQAAVEGRSLLALATHGLSTLDQPASAARTWSDLEAQGAQLHQRLQTLGRHPPEEWLGTAVARTDQSLQALRSAADADRALRLGPPPPTSEQLGYSEAVVRQRSADFEQELGGLDAAIARGDH